MADSRLASPRTLLWRTGRSLKLLDRPIAGSPRVVRLLSRSVTSWFLTFNAPWKSNLSVESALPRTIARRRGHQHLPWPMRMLQTHVFLGDDVPGEAVARQRSVEARHGGAVVVFLNGQVVLFPT